MMRLVIYVSEYTGDEQALAGDIRDIREQSTRHNDSVGITGVLIYENRHFVQALEGSEATIADMVERLLRDPRHRELQFLVDIPIQKREFSQWKMDSLNLDKTELFTSEMLLRLRDAYERNVIISDAIFVRLLQDMFNTPGIEEILNS